MKVTSIKEIAALAGVGTSTVSRVINNKTDVSEETRQRVLNVIKENHFEPNTNARNLKQTNSKTICVIVKGTFNPFFSRIVEIIQNKIEENKYTPLVRYINEGSDQFKAAKRLTNEKKPVGIIFLGGGRISREYLEINHDIPFVFATSSAEEYDYPNVSSVCVDDLISAKNAVDHLFDCGHKKIAVIGARRINSKIKNDDLVAKRFEGVLKSYEQHNTKWNDALYIESKFSMSDAYMAASKLIQKHKFTALFAMSDIMAIGAAKAIFDAGLKVPEDISIIGYDGIDMSFFYNPTLATMRQPGDDIATKSVELLMNSINQVETENRHIVLNTTIVEGKSILKV